MELNRELCASRRKLSQQCWQDDSLDAASLFGIVLFNSHERSELTFIFTSIFTSESSVFEHMSKDS